MSKKEEVNATEAKLRMFSEFGDGWVEFTAPIFTTSESNGGCKKVLKRNGKTTYKAEHWTAKSDRHKKQKKMVAMLLNPNRKLLRMPVRVSFTRYAPRELDRHDNLPMSLKWVLDAICEIITQDFVAGRADSHSGLKVDYKQVKSEDYWVKVRIQNLPDQTVLSNWHLPRAGANAAPSLPL